MAMSLILRHSRTLQGNPMKAVLGTYAANFHQLNTNKNVTLSKNATVVSLAKVKSFPIMPVVPARSMSAGNHSMMWTFEKAISAVLLPLLPATVLMPNPILDNLTSILLIMHVHWGMESCVIDYCRPIVIGKIASKLCHLIVYVVSILSLGGLIYFNQNDIGLGNLINCLWYVKSDELQTKK